MKGIPRTLSRAGLPRSPIQIQTIPVRALAISMTTITTGPGSGTVVAAGLPEGNILFLGAVAALTFSGPGASGDLVDTWEGDFAVGTAPLAGVTIETGEEDIIPETALAAATAEVSPLTKANHLVAVTGTIFDNTASTLEVNINALIDAADQTDDTVVVLTIDGEIYLSYIVLGDD